MNLLIKQVFNYKLLISLLFLTSALTADIKSTKGHINFDIQADNQPEIILNDTGLGIGITPSTKLHVSGNAILNEQVFVGGNSGSSNLNINGTIGYGFQSVNSSTTLSDTSIVLADTSAGNIHLSLPTASSYEGRKYTIKKTSPLNNLSITGGGFIDDYSDITLGVNFMGSTSLISYSGNWHILNMNGNGELIAAENLVGWWKLDDSTGTAGLDSSSSSQSSTLLNGFTFSSCTQTGTINQALSFDGIDDYMTIDNPLSGNPTTVDFTISFWVYWDSSDASVLLRDSTNSGGTLFMWDNSGTPRFRVGGTNGNANGTSSDYQDKWILLTLTNDKTISRLYSNGEMVGSLSPGSNPFVSPWRVARNGTLGVYDKCTIDDLRIYNKSLNSSEVKVLYSQGN